MSDFHFIRPWWWLAVLVLIFALNLLKKYRLSQSGWQQLLPKHLANVLVDGKQQQQSFSVVLPFIIGLLAITALAGPTWKKLPQPVYQVARGSVLIMDMSYSMYSTDVSPNRLTRSRFKAIDLLEQLNEGEIGLIAYAGDAFTISPLTDDINNIKLLLPSLTPELMPELGSNPYAALTLAHDMLTNAGHAKGDIYWFTDGIDNIDIQDITDWSRSNNHRLNILGIGSKTGAPIKLENGELMKDNSGAIIVPKLSISALQGSAKIGRGFYSTITNSNDDIEQLLKKPLDIEDQQEKESSNTGDQWQEVGPYLLLLLLPLLLPYFRRGRLLAILPLCLFLTPVEKSYAQEGSSVQKETAERSYFQNTWQDLWKTKDQQAQKQFNNENFQEAAGNFQDTLWQGTAHYRAGDYEQALQAFQQQTSLDALYNQGNALAKLERYDEAIEAYKQVLEKEPQHSDALANKTYLEEMKKQQEQEQQENNEEQSDEENKDQQKQDNKEQGDKDQNKEQQKSDDESQQSSTEQEKNKNESEESDSQSEQEKSQEEKEQEEKEKQAQESEANKDDKEQSEQTPAQMRAAEKLAEETKQKHQQLLNKVTDDPYMLLRNKMQLEYQKRRHNRSSLKGTKQW